MDSDLTAAFSDASANLEQLESQCTNLSSRKLSTLEILWQKPKQTVGKGAEKQAKLISQ